MSIIKKFLNSNFGLNFLISSRDRQRIIIGLTKGMISKSSRIIDYTNPFSWEFSGLSQNGEDGIINVLKSKLNKTNKYFIEIGSADGIDNNTSWLLITEKYNGLMIDANENLVNSAKRIVSHYSHGLRILNILVNKSNVNQIKKNTQFLDPDIFSLDIDSMDYYVAQELFDAGFRPKIFIVEYNSAFGPKESITIKYSNNFVFGKDHPSYLYYGVSVQGWKTFFENKGYKFITVDSNGVNAFFVDPKYYDNNFLDNINPVDFMENQLQKDKFRSDYKKQFEMIKHLSYHQIKE